MKLKILPCVCIDHKPSAGDSCYYGMPQLKVFSSSVTDRVYCEIKCPNCGRMGIAQYDSVHAALVSWNKTQEQLWQMKNNGEELP
jgi:hypothetical protein